MVKEYDKSEVQWKDFIPYVGTMEYFSRNKEEASKSPRIAFNNVMLGLYNAFLYAAAIAVAYKGLEKLIH